MGSPAAAWNGQRTNRRRPPDASTTLAIGGSDLQLKPPLDCGSDTRRRISTAAGRFCGSAVLWHAVPLALIFLIIWAPDRFLTQDGPAHIYTAKMLGRLLSGTRDDCCLVVVPPPPDSMTAWTGALLLPLFGTAITEKLWATLYTALLVGGGISFARVIQPGAPGLGIYLFVLNRFFFAGFWSFSLALGLLFLSLSATIELLRRPSIWRAVWVCMLGLSLYFTHLFGFAALLMALAILAPAELGKGAAAPIAKSVLCALAILVALGSVLVALQMGSFYATSDQFGYRQLIRDLRRISLGDSSAWYRYGEQIVIPALQLAVMAAALWRTARGRLPLHYGVFLAALLLLFAVFPDQLGDAMIIKARLWLLASLFAALCLPSRWMSWTAAVCVLLLSWHLWQVLPRQSEWNRQAAQLLVAAGKLEPGQTQASLMGFYWGRSSKPAAVVPLLHVDLLLAAATDSVSLSSNQLNSPEFSVHYRGLHAAAAGRIADLTIREVSSPDLLRTTVTDAGVRYVVVGKAGSLPWAGLKLSWRAVHETPDFLILDTGSN